MVKTHQDIIYLPLASEDVEQVMEMMRVFVYISEGK